MDSLIKYHLYDWTKEATHREAIKLLYYIYETPLNKEFQNKSNITFNVNLHDYNQYWVDASNRFNNFHRLFYLAKYLQNEFDLVRIWVYGSNTFSITTLKNKQL